ncbi:malonic semialdehyde reductase [Fimbriiglobus ruber]|nr:malonic semialdehyde reductase [Fimbriiglobus ruber]
MSANAHLARLDAAALDVLFHSARTHTAWLPEPVPTALLHELFDLVRLAPTSANSSPGRFVFLTTPAAKERLVPALMPGNVEKTRSAPVTVIIAQDMEFYENLPKLFPFADARSWFAGNDGFIADTAARNSSLEGAYLILAARALGLDCGPMSGFDPAKTNAEFFPDGKWRANFLCNLGYGDATKLYPRAPRLAFDEACVVL